MSEESRVPEKETLQSVLEKVAEWEKHYTPVHPHDLKPAAKRLEERLADQITKFVGSMVFVYLHTAWFAIWVLLNVGIIAVAIAFDPFPFGLLTLIVSLEAIFLSTFVMISQNRQAQIADHRAELDYKVNVRCEIEVAKLVALVHSLATHIAEQQTEAAKRQA